MAGACAVVVLGLAGWSITREVRFHLAVYLLETTKPQSIIKATIDRDAERGKAEKDLFTQQWEALETIHKMRRQVDLAVLIPFAGMEKDFSEYSFFYAPPSSAPNLPEAKVKFPAVGAIVDMPGAGDALEKYCRDPKNCLDYRMTALHVLALLDAKRFYKVTENLWSGLESSLPENAQQNVAYVLNFWESGRTVYVGSFQLLPYAHFAAEGPADQDQF